jgi:arginyl-tRNA synthetase
VTDEATKKITEHKLGEGYDPAEKIDIAHKVGVAALKFADLSNNPIANYVFDLDRFSSFEGKTGPYLLYAAVRVKSLLRKAREQNDTPGTILSPEPGERDLLLALGQLPDAIEVAYADLAPNKIADFAFTLGQTFSAYYANFHILSETDTAIRRSRLAIAELVLKELELCLELLGIATPERM